MTNPLGDEHDWSMLHYATGLLMGLGTKHGVIDVVIYHNGIRVRIERVDQKKSDDQQPDAGGLEARIESKDDPVREVEALLAAITNAQELNA